MLLTVLALVGVGVIGASGALAAVRARLDLFGVVVLAMVTALGGGIARDVLLAIRPPTSLVDWRNLVVSGGAGLAVFWLHPHVARLRKAVLLADAVGLGLFTTASTVTALDHGAPMHTACLIGMIGGIGGGVLRDVLLREIPFVLRKEIYALAALPGAMVVTLGARFALPAGPVSLVGAALICTVRVLALWRHWNAPIAGGDG
ncbi:TRIC cation channel family protein [Pendulispora rubella]|uniref:TRIC cation channel family protein n=1 Tax=Pendulispora rubella TaxID=2741070 RepID=A0ABZ2L3G5_9BACT